MKAPNKQANVAETIKRTLAHMTRQEIAITLIMLTLLVAMVVALGPATLGAVTGASGAIVVSRVFLPAR
ncbi:MAG TPA: hypothetical protein VFM49_07315 [Chloroflexia bacterium]|jgi:hypothetical protein|nr:hypothetical protein [Chloroflexia bacterium]